jgi:hypothetical protein
MSLRNVENEVFCGTPLSTIRKSPTKVSVAIFNPKNKEDRAIWECG